MDVKRNVASFQIPVEIYIIFRQNENVMFTVQDIRKIIKAYLRIDLQTKRVCQIVNGFYETSLINKEVHRVGRSDVNHYTLNKRAENPVIHENNLPSIFKLLREQKIFNRNGKSEKE